MTDVSLFVRAYPPVEAPPGPAICLPFQGDQLLLPSADGETPCLPSPANALPVEFAAAPPLYLGTQGGVPCVAYDIKSDAPVPEGWQGFGLRALLSVLPDENGALAGYAAQIVHWARTSRFCPVCGGPTEAKDGDWGRVCAWCGHVRYPQVTPAVLILVYDEARILLAHKPGWGPMHSILAGFVEPGETLEECAARETEEEAGVRVDSVEYQGSQAWPFPHQLMVGFTARYRSGALRPDEMELDGAAWFTVDNLPALPSSISLSRRLIDAWAQAQRPG